MEDRLPGEDLRPEAPRRDQIDEELIPAGQARSLARHQGSRRLGSGADRQGPDPLEPGDPLQAKKAKP